MLELFYLPTERSLRHMQMIARLADAAHLGHGLKGAKLAKVHVFPASLSLCVRLSFEIAAGRAPYVVRITLLEPAWRAT